MGFEEGTKLVSFVFHPVKAAIILFKYAETLTYFVRCYLKPSLPSGVQSQRFRITWEPVGNAGSQASLRPTESESAF